MNNCPYNFETCTSFCENWDETYGCKLFSNIKSFEELEERLNSLNDTENITMKSLSNQTNNSSD